jgi:hypothetical protein
MPKIMGGKKRGKRTTRRASSRSIFDVTIEPEHAKAARKGGVAPAGKPRQFRYPKTIFDPTVRARRTRKTGGPLLVNVTWKKEPDKNRDVHRSPWGHPMGRVTPVERILGAKPGEHPWGGGEDERRPNRRRSR